MRLVKPSYQILSIYNQHGIFGSPLQLIEQAGRVCYKSESKITPESSKEFCQKLTKLGHESVIEHSAMTVKFIVDRGVSHEMVRHRLCAFSQESTRYCNYKGGVTFIIPPWVNIKEQEILPGNSMEVFHCDADGVWLYAMAESERRYIRLIDLGWSPQKARGVLDEATKTELVVTANFREWRHIFKLRTSKAAHPQMREITIPLLKEVKEIIPVLFDDIKED